MSDPISIPELARRRLDATGHSTGPGFPPATGNAQGQPRVR